MLFYAKKINFNLIFLCVCVEKMKGVWVVFCKSVQKDETHFILAAAVGHSWHSPALCSGSYYSISVLPVKPAQFVSVSLLNFVLCYSLQEIKAVRHFLKMPFLKQNPKIHRNIVCWSWAEITLPVSGGLLTPCSADTQ